MLTSLLRTVFGVLLLGLGLGLGPAAASHLVGGELTYSYLDATGTATSPYRYRILARIYLNKEPGSSSPDGPATINVQIFSKAASGQLVRSVVIQKGSFGEITPPGVPGCASAIPRVTLATYTAVVELPAVVEGYVAVYSASARNEAISNILAPGQESMTLSVEMTPGMLRNSSPAFSDNALSVICRGDTSNLLNNAYDVDGDRLSYSLAAPLGGSQFTPVRYASGYSAAQPFGSTGYAAVDARTGLSRYFCKQEGTFLLGVNVREYRTINGVEVLLGTLRRDIQVVVRTCAGGNNKAPVFTAATIRQKDFTVAEGEALNFPVSATDPEGQLLTMNVKSVLLDGPGGIDATVNGQSGDGGSSNAVGTVTALGAGAITSNFHLTAGCGMARQAAYDVLVTVVDEGCGAKSIVDVFRITVTRAAGLTQVRGDSVLCVQTQGRYTAVGLPFGQYRWSAQGGQVVGTPTGPTAQVRWEKDGLGTVTVSGLTPEGCPTDAVSRTVMVRSAPIIVGPTTYCRTANTDLSYSVAGPAAAYQWIISNGVISSGQGTNTVQVTIDRGATAFLQVVGTGAGACLSPSLSVGPDNTCLMFYNVVTPNADAQNDRFVIENVERHPNTELTIFNRWGRQLYHSDDYRNTFGAEDTSAGMYYYVCRLADGTRYKGWFEVVR